MKLAALTLALTAAAAASSNIPEPEAFVREVYRHIEANANHSDYNPPEGTYTPRLAAIRCRSKTARRRGRMHRFRFLDQQSAAGIPGIRVTSSPQRDPARKTVIATFTLDHPMEIHFEFRRIDGRWLLADAGSVKGEPWTSSRLLRRK